MERGEGDDLMVKSSHTVKRDERSFKPEYGSTTCCHAEPTQFGQRGHHRVPVPGIDVLRRIVRDVVHIAR